MQEMGCGGDGEADGGRDGGGGDGSGGSGEGGGGGDGSGDDGSSSFDSNFDSSALSDSLLQGPTVASTLMLASWRIDTNCPSLMSILHVSRSCSSSVTGTITPV